MAKSATPKDRFLPRLTRFFFNKPRVTSLLFIVLTAFGVLSYTHLLRREGFPSINIPLAIVTGTYQSSDPAEVDKQVGKPLTDEALKLPGVNTVQTQSGPNFATVTIQFKEGTDAASSIKTLQQRVATNGAVAKSARLQYTVPTFGVTGGDTQKIDLGISFYKVNGEDSPEALAAAATRAAAYLQKQHIPYVEGVTIKDPFKTVTDPVSGKAVYIQTNFDRYGVRQEGKTHFYTSVLLGVSAKKGFDVITLDTDVRKALANLEKQPEFKDYRTAVSASFAPAITDNINELQRVLIEGLIAVLLIGTLLITLRASVITVLSMVSVIAITLGFLYVIGYTLNVITLFALILGLSLVVDDTIIMVEAIDAARKRLTNRRQIVIEASRKISRAMVAATLTSTLSFSPLLFIGGVLGTFIRAIPITIIASLLISLFVALILIPLLSRFLLLGKKQLGEHGVTEIGAAFEARIARAIARPMLWAQGSMKRLWLVGLGAIVIGLGFVAASVFVGKGVSFNIFPPTKDSNGMYINLAFKPGTSLKEAQAIQADADTIAGQVLGSNFEQSSLYTTGDTQMSSQRVLLIPYNKREISSSQLAKQVQFALDAKLPAAKANVYQEDVGPPASSFSVQLDATDRPAALAAATAMKAFLDTAKLERPDGTTATFTNPTVANPALVIRNDGKAVITVAAGFSGTDTSLLTTLAQSVVKKEFNAQKLQSYGLSADALKFNLGQESENQDSFKTLALAFPIVLGVIYLLLVIEFRSFLQPLLIFLAIPFSLFGIMLGLRLTNNPISFFGMLGFFALIGLSIKNTILLTDYANQARRAGNGAVASAVAALEERFRPLVATSLTAVVSLIPLAISSPFWQGLAVVLIFGLLSSTLLVVTIFPYLYLGAEFARTRLNLFRLLRRS